MHARLRRPAVALLATTLAAGVLGAAPAAEAAAVGSIEGAVTGPGGAAIPFAQVTFYVLDPATREFTWFQDGWARADGEGRYSKDLPAGDYLVQFSDFQSGDHLTEYWDDAYDRDDADVVTVGAGDEKVADAELAPAAHVTGRLTGPGGAPVGFTTVYAFRHMTTESGFEYHQQIGGAQTDANGAYDIGTLAPGIYRIQFGDSYSMGGQQTDHATEWWADRASLESGTDLVVPAAGREGIDAELGLDSEVSGRVVGADDTGLEGVVVGAARKIGTQWHVVATTRTSEDGTYLLDGLQTGTYRFVFNDFSNGEPIVEWWDDTAFRGKATAVEVGPNTEVEGIDAALVAGEHDDEVGLTVTNTIQPTISGSPVVGSTLTASTGTWNPQPTQYFFEWFIDGVPLMGHYESTYVPTAADVGKSISVLVTAGGVEDHAYGNAMSASTAPVAGAPVIAPPATSTTPATGLPTTPPATTAPTVDVPAGLAAVLRGVDTSGKPRVGRTVKVTGLDTLFRSTTAVSYTFQWFAGSTKVKKATRSKLKVVPSMKGTKLAVRVTATAASTSRSVKLKVGRVS
ncbi:hypothetical protein F4692_001695 [Nocardioides cavernae]|uniref:alpha-amylase n=1 Tax=Nocardioides cavernae TaxID=1921566 RepID=A0A7Y9H246_9ACTN|nr:hypothetical protein [Nocardioides cavernae]NYE36562.1 hypothetical protein [Nocardioides cavernae]